MLWKQAPPIRLGQQANKRGQDQHDEIGRRNTIETEHDNERCLFWSCCWRTSRSWEGRLGCARKEQQEWSAKPWNCESLKNNLCHIHLIMMFKNIHLIMMFKMLAHRVLVTMLRMTMFWSRKKHQQLLSKIFESAREWLISFNLFLIVLYIHDTYAANGDKMNPTTNIFSF